MSQLRACLAHHFSHIRLFWPIGLLCPWESPGKSSGMRCHALLQDIKAVSLMPPELADKSIRDSVLVQIQASWDVFWDSLRPAPVDATAPS